MQRVCTELTVSHGLLLQLVLFLFTSKSSVSSDNTQNYFILLPVSIDIRLNKSSSSGRFPILGQGRRNNLDFHSSRHIHSHRSTITQCISMYLSAIKVSFLLYSAPLTLRRLMSYIYGAPILDVSRSHTTTQHSR